MGSIAGNRRFLAGKKSEEFKADSLLGRTCSYAGSDGDENPSSVSHVLLVSFASKSCSSHHKPLNSQLRLV